MKGLQEKISVQEHTGVVHIPTVHRSRPGHPRGTYRYFKCADLGGEEENMYMHMTPGRENVLIEFTLQRDLIPHKKYYQLSMRFQTNVDQAAPLKLVVKRRSPASSVILTEDIPIPNTHNKWQSMEPPIKLDVEIGGAPDTMLEFTHPKPAGKGILIRDFSLTPLSIDQVGGYSASWFHIKLEELNNHVKEKILPKIGSTSAFIQACQVVEEARKKEDQAAKGGDDQDKKTAAQEHKHALNVCSRRALPLLEYSDNTLKTLNWKDQKKLLQCLVLHHATPDHMANYCARGDQEKNRLMKFLDNTDLMMEFFIHGSPRNGCYGRALEIYQELEARRRTDKTVFPRLALAVALELCDPLAEFGTPKIFVDPIHRYLHYESAYINRELDPAFETFSVWELRHVVNSNATDCQLAWCREMIRNFNPSIVTMDDQHWRYAWIVRTEVHYKSPGAVCLKT
jgi:hypothetical protein